MLVINVPLFVNVLLQVKAKVEMSNVVEDGIVKALVSVMTPPAVFVPDVLLRVKVL